MGIFTKSSDINTDIILPYINSDTASLVWSITGTVDNVDTVSVDGYTDLQLSAAFEKFLRDHSDPKVLRYALEYDEDTFTHLDYIRGLDVRLAPKRTFVKGVLTHVDYYAAVSLDAQGQEVFDDLVVSEHYDYTRNSDGFAISRSLTISWILESGEKHTTTKVRVKTYNLTESLRETARRRQNVLDGLQTDMIGLFVTAMSMTLDQAMSAGMDFFETHITEITAFKEIGALTHLIEAIQANTTHAWLNLEIAPGVTVRAFVISKLSEAYLGT